MNRQELLDYAAFVASRFERNHEGWTYSRNVGDLEHIRYRHDHRGRYHWTRRLIRAFNPAQLLGMDRFSRMVGQKASWAGAWWHIVLSVGKGKNLPDGVVNGGSIITFWEEDGEYIILFSPSVGMKVLEWLRAEPDNPYAVAVVEEMNRLAELSWGDKED